ncbi:MAG: Bug family tripartite tricarboxylate transporter substrate binding protein [Burkholderiales bacterium]
MPALRRVFCPLLIGVAALVSGLNAQAQTFPDRPIAFVYPYPPGSATEVAFRAIVQEASRRLGQPIVFENRSGAVGRIGFEHVLRSAPDGYNLGLLNNILGVSLPLIDPKTYVEPGRDYTPVALAVESFLILVARGSEPYRDVRGLIEFARANPGKLNMATPGTGTGAHLVLALLGARAGANIAHIPYKGTAPATLAILSGEVNLTLTDTSVRTHVESGKLIALATTGAQRWASFPNVPTFEEQGLKGVVYGAWSGVMGPPGMPAAVVTRLNRAFAEALGTPEVKTRLDAAGLSGRGGPPEEWTAKIRSELASWRPVIQGANIKLDP